MSNKSLKHIKHLISDGKIESAIKNLLVITENSQIHNEFLYQASRLSNYKQRTRRKDMSEYELEVIYNSIIISTIELIGEIDNNELDNIPNRLKEKKSKLIKNNILLIILILTIPLLGILFVFFQKKTVILKNKEWTAYNLSEEMGDAHFFHWDINSYKKYGRLYTLREAIKVCEDIGPNWRLPTDKEWSEVANHFGGLEIGNDSIKGNPEQAYFALKEGGISKFNLLKGGFFDNKIKKCQDLRWSGSYWSSTPFSKDEFWVYTIDADEKTIYKIPSNENQRISCRCIRNIE